MGEKTGQEIKNLRIRSVNFCSVVHPMPYSPRVGFGVGSSVGAGVGISVGPFVGLLIIMENQGSKPDE